MELNLAARQAITRNQIVKWPKATKTEKTDILNAVCSITGWHRDHARKAIRHAVALHAAGELTRPRKPRTPVQQYSVEAIGLLTKCWAALDGPTGKRLQPALPHLIVNMRHHGECGDASEEVINQVLTMSAATIDRRLAPARKDRDIRKGVSHTRPGSMLATSIPHKTWRDWADTPPGALQIDLVGHEGGDNNGQFHFTLDAVDVRTGWTESITVFSKGERVVAAGLSELVQRFPFHIHSIHSDNGSEFINHHLTRWCQARNITFTRGRSSHKNDQAHVEQKNWTVVRRNVGYFRYDAPEELALLNKLWLMVSDQVNLFLPQQRLLSKTRVGAKVHKTYEAAITPYERLLRDWPELLDEHDQQRLKERAGRNIVAIKRDITDLQAELIRLARERGIVNRRAKTNAAYLSRRKILPATRASSDESTKKLTRAS